MDKETLSNYGWIVICVLVLAVMIALATPFGEFISNAVQNTKQGLFDVNQNALSVISQTRKHEQIISKGGRYYSSIDGRTYTDGDAFPKPELGDTYYYGQYSYLLGYLESDYVGLYWYTILNVDRDKTEYESPLECINGIDKFSLANVFADCTNLIHAPKIPQGTIVGNNTFKNCISLISTPIINSNMYYADYMFANCISLTNPPDMINAINLSNADYMFEGCTSLTHTPNMKNIKKVDLTGTFSGCTNLITMTDFPIASTVLNHTFDNCISLKEIYVPCNHYNTSWENCNALVTVGNQCVH